jgi:hypothetical protein
MADTLNYNRTAYLLGEAGEDENDEIQNGFNGDQTGFELRARSWYQHNPVWAKVYRFDDDVAEAIAVRMEKAITNGMVGYDSNHRNQFLDRVVAVDYNYDLVNYDGTCDCSSLVYTVLFSITGLYYDGKSEYPVIMPVSPVMFPKVRQFDHYIERQCVNAGYKVTVFTLDTSKDVETAGYTKIDFKDGVSKWYKEPYYNTPWDYYDSGADDIKVKENLKVVYVNQPNGYGYNESFLTSLATYKMVNGQMDTEWQRGDIIRTLSVRKSDGKYTGHIAVWLY